LLQESVHQGRRTLLLSPKEGAITLEARSIGVDVKISAIPWWVSTREKKIPLTVSGAIQFLRLKKRLVKQYLTHFRDAKKLSDQLLDWKGGIIYTNSSVTPFGRMLAKYLSCKHIWHIRELVELHYSKKYDLGKWTTALLIRRSSTVICVSYYVVKYMFNSHKKNIFVVYNGVIDDKKIECERINRIEKNRSSDEVNIFVLVGSFSAKKNQDVAINAVACLLNRFPKIRLYLVGDGSDKEILYLESLCEKLGVSKNVKFCGYVNDPFEIYRLSDVALVCSRHEAMGRVTAEAMAAGLPVIGLKEGGTEELISDGQTGILYEGGSEQLAQAMCRLIENPQISKNIGLAGIARAQEMFTNERYKDNIFRIID
jgi:glycosyltransferase involved in cell wall biosynthesis